MARTPPARPRVLPRHFLPHSSFSFATATGGGQFRPFVQGFSRAEDSTFRRVDSVILAVVGLAAEARLARRAGMVPLCAGGDPGRTERALAEALARTGVDGIISFGVAGGLAPALRPGALVIADAVLGDAERVATSPLRLQAHVGPVWGAALPAASAAQKAALYRRTGALAVDLESLVVARLATRASIPFWIVRAVADPAERSLPAAALVPLRGDGHPDLPSVLRSVARTPSQIPALIRLAFDTRAALGTLAQAAPSIAAELGRTKD